MTIWLLNACATAPFDYPREPSVVITDTQETRLGKDVTKWEQQHPGTSGFYPLLNGIDALGARLALMDYAERSIDAQYFLMKHDMAGEVFVRKLLEAADRGVRVRLLLDDVFTTVKDDSFLKVNQHPNIEIRLFNPVGRGGVSYWTNYIGDFARANRRMHNKSFTIDNQVSIVGGRNIAEEYYEIKTGEEFYDVDMLCLGSVAGEIAKTFDQFWNHELSLPVDAFNSKKSVQDLSEVRAELSENNLQQANAIYKRAIESTLIQDLINGRALLYPASSEVVTDDPEKLLNKVSPEHQALITRMAEVLMEAEDEVIVITPYLVPGKKGVAFWEEVAGNGVKIIMLTNSLASNNHIPVHAAYSGYRHDLIRAGVELYEMRVNATSALKNNGEAEDSSKSATLHTKAIIIDRDVLFIGSLNLDPRSIDINSEMGVLIKSDDMSTYLTENFLEILPGMSYRVVESESGALRWHGMIDGQEVIEKHEPQSSVWRRFTAFMAKILPESQM